MSLRKLLFTGLSVKSNNLAALRGVQKNMLPFADVAIANQIKDNTILSIF